MGVVRNGMVVAVLGIAALGSTGCQNKLAAENNVRLDQLTFGDKVESPTATKLPVLLAVSLLKDRSGVIDIDLPISGSLDDPQFSVGGLIVRVIVNLLTKMLDGPPPSVDPNPDRNSFPSLARPM